MPLELEYLRTITFILVIAASVQFTEIMVRRLSPLLDQVLGIYIPLIATNCAVLGVALLNVQQSSGFVQSVFYGLGAAGGFALVLVMFAAIRERLEAADIPAPFRGYGNRADDRGHHVARIHGIFGNGAAVTRYECRLDCRHYRRVARPDRGAGPEFCISQLTADPSALVGIRQ